MMRGKIEGREKDRPWRSEPSAFVETATRGTIETRGAHMHAYIHPHGYQNRSTEGSLVCRGREGSVSVSCAVRHRREASVSLRLSLRSPLRCCVRMCLQDHRAHRMLREARVVISSYRVSARYIVLDLAHQLHVPVRWKQLERVLSSWALGCATTGCQAASSSKKAGAVVRSLFVENGSPRGHVKAVRRPRRLPRGRRLHR